MRDELEKRLKELQTEFESGQNALNELETKKQNLRETLLRISGAIQVLEEELDKHNSANGEPPQPVQRELDATAEAEAIRVASRASRLDDSGTVYEP